jgi:hypothetical protein
MSDYTIEYKGYNKEPVELYIGAIARAFGDVGKITRFLSDFVNYGMKDYQFGLEIGRNFQREHRTLQGSIIRLCLGIIIGLSEQKYTDPRNEVPVSMAKEIAKQIEDGDLKMGWMI